jgi:Cytochrome P460
MSPIWLRRRSALAFFAALAPAACSSGTPAAPSGAASADASAPEGTLDDARIEAAASTYATAFARVNRAPFATQQHAGNPMVNVYANDVAVGTYRAIAPSAPAPAGFAFRPGSMLVKEMLDASGRPEVLTVMYKKAPGYDVTHHDWWYGRLDPSGAPTQPSYAGKVDFCVACHEGAAGSDYAWGVATGR